jgi:hypothetical protein
MKCMSPGFLPAVVGKTESHETFTGFGFNGSVDSYQSYTVLDNVVACVSAESSLADAIFGVAVVVCQRTGIVQHLPRQSGYDRPSGNLGVRC